MRKINMPLLSTEKRGIIFSMIDYCFLSDIEVMHEFRSGVRLDLAKVIQEQNTDHHDCHA